MNTPHTIRTELRRGFAAGLAMLFVAYNATALTTNTFSFMNLDQPVPDGSGSGMSFHTNLTSTISLISAARVRLKVTGEFNGDLYAYLRHVTPNGTAIAILLNRPGRTATDAHGYDGAGLDITFNSTAAGDVHMYGDFTNLPPGQALSGTWQPDGRKINPNVVTDTSSRNTSLDAFAAMEGAGEWTLFVADLESGGTNLLNGWELELVGQAATSVTWPTPSDVVYGTPLSGLQLNATSPISGTFSYTPNTNAVLNAGSNQVLTAVFTPTDTVSYSKTTNTVLINVQRRALALTANNTSKVYGQTLSLAGTQFTSSGLINGDTVTSVTLSSAGTPATATVAGSPYAIVPSAAVGTGLANYSISYGNGTLTISAASIAGVLSSSLNPALPGQSLTLSHALSAVSPGSGTPTGTVRFKLDGVSLATTSLSGGVASLTTSAIGFGSHAVVAEYAGDGNFLGVTNSLGTNLVINTPPTAVADSVTRYPTNGFKISISSLLSNDIESDATDTIHLASLSATSTLGGMVVSNGDWIYYTAPAGNTNPDSFTYRIADTLGGSSSGTVTIITSLGSSPSLTLKIAEVTAGNYVISFDGIPNSVYDIETTPKLNPTTWQLWMTTNTDANGMISITDTSANGATNKFYRTLFKY